MSKNEEIQYAVYINGKIYPKEEAMISVFDHGFLYGDGIFEGIRMYDGKVFRLDDHIDRLFDSLKAIRLELPMTKQEMRKIIIDTFKAADIRNGQVRPIITRGLGILGMDPRHCTDGPTVIVIAYGCATPVSYLAKKDIGLKAKTSAVRRIPPECLDAKIKSLNYLNLVLAKIEAIASGADEAILLDTRGYIAEGAGDNLFMVKNGILLTGLLTSSLGGITRKTVIEIARNMGIEVAEGEFTLHTLYSADEVFLTGTNIEIVPVVEVDGRKIGDGKPGPILKRIQEAYIEFVKREGKTV